jgi:hypothetical protein
MIPKCLEFLEFHPNPAIPEKPGSQKKHPAVRPGVFVI